MSNTENRRSDLLTNTENENVFNMLGKKCQVSWYCAWNCVLFDGQFLVFMYEAKLPPLFQLFLPSLVIKSFLFVYQTLATAVVQLVVAFPESRSRWSKKTTGVACFVKDNAKRSYFIRIYDLSRVRLCTETVITFMVYYGIEIDRNLFFLEVFCSEF